jgi:hypothetical protein
MDIGLSPVAMTEPNRPIEPEVKQHFLSVLQNLWIIGFLIGFMCRQTNGAGPLAVIRRRPTGDTVYLELAPLVTRLGRYTPDRHHHTISCEGVFTPA